MGKAKKGGSWERDCSRYLTEWLTGQKKELYFWRSPGSGSVAQINLGNKDISGDIIALKPEATLLLNKFSLELKYGYKDVSLDKFLKCNKSDLLKDFWVQCVDDAIKADKLPLLIYKKHGMPSPWLGIEETFFKFCIDKLNGLRYIHLYWDDNYPDTYFFDMKLFFKQITPNIIKNF